MSHRYIFPCFPSNYELLLRLCLLSAWLIILVVISCWCLATICCVTVSVFHLPSPLSNILTNNLILTFRAKTILSLLNLGLYFSFFSLYWDSEYWSCIFSIHVATFWRFQILLKLKIWKAKGLASKIWHLLRRMKYSNPNWNCPEPRLGLFCLWIGSIQIFLNKLPQKSQRHICNILEQKPFNF